MINGQFKINNSLIDGAWIQLRPEINSPKRSKEFIRGVGNTGSSIYSNGGYEDSSMNLTLFVDKYSNLPDKSEWDKIELNRQLINNIFDSSDWIKFTPYWAPDYYYLIALDGDMRFLNDYRYEGSIAVEIPLKVFPYKYLIEGTVEKEYIPSRKKHEIIGFKGFESRPLLRFYDVMDKTNFDVSIIAYDSSNKILNSGKNTIKHQINGTGIYTFDSDELEIYEKLNTVEKRFFWDYPGIFIPKEASHINIYSDRLYDRCSKFGIIWRWRVLV